MGPNDGGITLSWADVAALCDKLAAQSSGWTGVYGVPTGGCFPALLLAQRWNIPLLDSPAPGCLVVDDICDSGRTLRPFRAAGNTTEALVRKPASPADLAPGATVVGGWVRFPWEHETGAEDSVVRLLQYIGEDPDRDGLVETPKRVLKAFREMTAGYRQDPKEILSKRFASTYDQVVAVRDIEFVSLCEHHLLPFSGVAHVGYIPTGPVVGLSKVARLVDCFARRLQIQEQMTQQIAHAIETHLDAQGVAVIVTAKHHCMSCRGVMKKQAAMTTSVMLGAFRESPSARQEFLSLVGM